MTESPDELAAVEQLLTERDAIYGWMTRLDQAPVQAPESVRARVKRDYQERLDQITAGLRSHSDVVARKLADDRRIHDDLVARGTAAREALAEVELRHAVGEFDDPHFEGERARYAADIESLDANAADVAERIDRLEEVQALADRAPAAPAIADTAAESVEESAQPGERVEEELMVDVDVQSDAESDRALAIFDESVSTDESSAEVPRTAPEVGPLTFRPSGATEPPGQRPTGRSAPFETAAPLGIPGADRPPRFVRPGERMRPVRTVPPVNEGAPETSELLEEDIVASGPPPEAISVPVGRTLRCGECGAMNRPLEWYCEKCGAELTAV